VADPLRGRRAPQDGLKTLKVGYRDGEGYFIEIAGKEGHAVPPHYEHRKALKNAARYVTVELKEHESRMLNARDEVERLERQILGEIRSAVKEAAPQLQRVARAVAVVDVVSSFAAARASSATAGRRSPKSGACE
jgi:DNA mismatch repair protein MutS